MAYVDGKCHTRTSAGAAKLYPISLVTWGKRTNEFVLIITEQN